MSVSQQEMEKEGNKKGKAPEIKEDEPLINLKVEEWEDKEPIVLADKEEEIVKTRSVSEISRQCQLVILRVPLTSQVLVGGIN